MSTSFTDSVKQKLKEVRRGSINYYDLLKLKEECELAKNDVAILSELPDSDPPQLLAAFRKSKAQLRQDLFILSELKYKRDGFFVEFGAANGVDLSNTHLLEKEYGWSGILAEPARGWHEALRANRKCAIEPKCVWRDTGSILVFNEVGWGELSTIDAYSSSDSHSDGRKKGQKYDVETISLNDLLEKYKAPAIVDCLSIDTEGSELEILNAFDFNKHQFRVIVCEHNYTPQRQEIHALLTKNGYSRKYEKLSKFDDWYVRPALV